LFWAIVFAGMKARKIKAIVKIRSSFEE